MVLQFGKSFLAIPLCIYIFDFPRFLMRILAWGAAKTGTGATSDFTTFDFSRSFSKIFPYWPLVFVAFYPRLSIIQCSSIKRSSGNLDQEAGAFLWELDWFDMIGQFLQQFGIFPARWPHSACITFVLGVFYALCSTLAFSAAAGNLQAGILGLLVGTELSLKLSLQSVWVEVIDQRLFFLFGMNLVVFRWN